MNGAKSKEIKQKVFEKMFGGWDKYCYSDRKVLLEDAAFKKAYKSAKKQYLVAVSLAK